jgi:hypothetical protein
MIEAASVGGLFHFSHPATFENVRSMSAVPSTGT